MAKDKENFPEVDYLKFKTVEAVEEEEARLKNEIIHKLKIKATLEDEKKDVTSAYNSQIKVLNEEIDHWVGVIDQLGARAKELEFESNRPRVQPPTT